MTDKDEKRKLTRRTAVLTAMSAVMMGILIAVVYEFNVPNPNMILITALVLFTSLGGMIPGAVSGALMLAYSMFFFSTDHSFFRFTDLNLQKMWIIVLGAVMTVLVVGLLKRNRDEVDRKLQEQNRKLEEEARTAILFAEMSKSVNSLLHNIPALTFSKDIETGRYLACNQRFAAFAHKDDPESVVGLTDFDIFDHDTAAHFVEDDRLAMSMDQPYIFYEDVTDARGNLRHLQTIKQKYTDSSGRLCTLGLCVDVTELVNMKKETLQAKEAYENASRSSETFSSIARALSSDYQFLFSVDLDTDEFVEYASDPARNMLAVTRRGDNFFENSRRDSKKVLDPEEQEHFIRAFTKENVVHSLDTDGKFSIHYCLLINGSPVHMSMKAKRLGGEGNRIIIGVISIEAEVKQRQAAEQVRKDRITYARFTALSGDYLELFTVDPSTDRYVVYRADSGQGGLGPAKAGERFFDEAPKHASEIIAPEDLERVVSQFTKDNILRGIEENGVFALKYRQMMDGKPTWVNMKAAKVEESDGTKIIVGVNNIDAQIRKETEYERTLVITRDMAYRDALTGVKNRLAYLEAEEELQKQITDGGAEPFTLVLFDVNDLKVVNDAQGHQAGDEYLRVACRIICNVFKHSPVFRIGGDEFAAIAKDKDHQWAEKLLEQLREINRANVGTGEPIIAAGFARCDEAGSVSDVFRLADERMYAEKERLKKGK